jgi:hypothetical protein
MGKIVLLLVVLFFWFVLLKQSYRRLSTRRGLRSKLEPHYDLADPCPKRRGEAALCGYCPLFDCNTGECNRGRWHD